MALRAAEAKARAATEARMQAVLDAPSRIDCILRSRELWHADAVMLPLVLERWAIHEDEIREAVRRPPPVTEQFVLPTHRGYLPIDWTRRVP